jgi:hypothetical protein
MATAADDTSVRQGGKPEGCQEGVCEARTRRRPDPDRFHLLPSTYNVGESITRPGEHVSKTE